MFYYSLSSLKDLKKAKIIKRTIEEKAYLIASLNVILTNIAFPDFSILLINLILS